LNYELSTWLNLLFRWFHVVAGVLWIGQTAFFSWLDTRMKLEVDGEGREQVWMVHSGGFYRVDKLKAPEDNDRVLHWFKWEAAFTWLSGIFLLIIVYHLGGSLVDVESPLSVGQASALGFGSLIVGWLVYDLLWTSPLARKETVATALSLGLLVATGWLLSRYLSGRAAYIHVGALMGTIMTANVWMRILPGQRRMVKAVREGRKPDLRYAAIAKHRSTHNTFLALPVIFIMISNHFPTNTYGHRLNWLLLFGFTLAGFAARWAMNRWNER
jgi:uncharacterized membrane protein